MYLKDPQYRRGDPERDRLEERKARFSGLVDFCNAHHGFVVSIPGAKEVTVECLPGSGLPDVLRKMGYAVRQADPPTGTRILAHGIEERLTRNLAGDLEPITEGSTQPVEIRTHAGIVAVERWQFDLP
jgi:hypothetical protein